MKLFKRVSATLVASIDSAVKQIENHDAIVAANIKQARQSVAATQARLNRLNTQVAHYQKELDRAHEQQELWKDRATKASSSDRQKALQCMERVAKFEQEQERLCSMISQHQQLIREVDSNLRKLRSSLEDMERKHTLLRARQNVAEINQSVRESENNPTLADTFERWETTILENE
ncbi:MAG: PspA/IM30 family protein [Pseudomonadota bacterium]